MALHAQVTDDTSTLQGNYVVTGVGRPTKITDAVEIFKVINANTIQRQGAVNLKDVLMKEMNIRLGNDNILGSSISLQGISGQNIKILLDGVPIIGRENGNIDLGQLNLNNIERIEIIEGPLSVIYGSDALGGVINLISKKITIDKPFEAHASGYYETIKQYNFGGGATVKLKDIDFGVNLNRNFFGGFSPDGSRVMLWKPKQQVFGNFIIMNQQGKLRIRYKTDIFNEKIENRGTPVINHLEAYAFDEYYLTNRIISSLNLDYKVNNHSYWNVLSSLSFYQRDRITFRKDLTTTDLDLVPSPDANSSDRFFTVMSRGSYCNFMGDSNKLKNYFNYLVGYDVSLNSAWGSKIESDKGRMNDYAVFASAEIRPIKAVSIKPGLRANYNTRYPAPFIPSINVKVQPFRNLTIRYAYARGFRAPGLKELYLYFVDYNHNIKGNPDLKAEVSNNHNLALKLKVFSNRKRSLYFDNNYFYNHVYNQIAIVAINPATLEYTYQNIDNFRSQGTVVNFSMEEKRLGSASLGGSYMGIYNNAFQMLGKQKYSYTPELRAQVSFFVTHDKFNQIRDDGKGRDQMLGRTTFSVFYKYNGKTVGYALDNTRSLIATLTQAYSILDFSVNQPMMNKKFVVTFGLKNLLNVQTIQSIGSSNSFHSGGTNTMPVSVGRSVFIQLNVQL